jgi:hypothetical protein
VLVTLQEELRARSPSLHVPILFSVLMAVLTSLVILFVFVLLRASFSWRSFNVNEWIVDDLPHRLLCGCQIFVVARQSLVVDVKWILANQPSRR